LCIIAASKGDFMIALIELAVSIIETENGAVMALMGGSKT
jgi:hypothetical protein